jgi:transposase
VAEVSIVGLDLAKNVFQVHGACADGSVAFRRKLPRAKVLSFFAAQPPCQVAMEACASSHHWAREISALGHEVKLIAPAYVKPFAGTKEAQMIEMLKRPEGATVEQIAAATGVEWRRSALPSYGDRFLRPPLRTGRASFPASGSPCSAHG